MTYVDQSSKARMRQRIYVSDIKIDEWLPIAESVIGRSSGSPESYDYLLRVIETNLQKDRPNGFILPAPTIAKWSGRTSVNVRKHLDNLCQWSLLEVVGTDKQRLIYSLAVPIAYRIKSRELGEI